jgi:hypothetical protein
VSPATVIFSNRRVRSNSVKYIAAVSLRIEVTDNPV